MGWPTISARPALMSRNTSGFGAIFGGHTPNDDGTLASDRGVMQAMNQDVKPTFDVEEDDSDTPASAASVQTGRRASTPGAPKPPTRVVRRRRRRRSPPTAPSRAGQRQRGPAAGRTGAEGACRVRGGGPADQGRGRQGPGARRPGPPALGGHHAGGAAHPDPGRGQAGDVPERLGGAERPRAGAAAEGGAGPDEAAGAAVDHRPHRLRPVSRRGPVAIGSCRPNAPMPRGACCPMPACPRPRADRLRPRRPGPAAARRPACRGEPPHRHRRAAERRPHKPGG